MLTSLQADRDLAGLGWAWLGSSASDFTLAWLHTVDEAQDGSSSLCAEARLKEW